MRAAFRLPLIIGMLVILAVGLVGYQEHAVESAIEELDVHLEATTIDFTCAGLPPHDALRLVLQRLGEKDAWFKECTFQLDFVEPQPPDPLRPGGPSPLVTLELEGISGYEAIQWVCDIADLNYGLRPRMVAFAPIDGPLSQPARRYLTWAERAHEAFDDWLWQVMEDLRTVWYRL